MKAFSITEDDVRRLASPKSFERGVGYYNGGAIFEPTRQEEELRAYCHGSGYEPYRVTATLGSGLSTYCTCPYDWGGICKHIVALLLTWIHEPEIFDVVPPLDEALVDRSKEELIALIKEMLKREPDLVRLLELPVQPDRQTPLDLSAFRRQINHAFGYDYPDAQALARELSAIVETADRFLEAGDWADAGALYDLILDEVVPAYENLYDETGDVAFELQRCVKGLENCFSQGSPDAATREVWLETLLEAELKDVEMGGRDLAYPTRELLIHRANEQEWDWIEARVRQAIVACQDKRSRWRQETLVWFIADRLEQVGHEEEIDDLIFELGSPKQQAFHLIQLERFDEALEIARGRFDNLPGLVVRFADALVAAGAGSMAVAYVTSLLDTHSKHTYLSWLAEHAEKQEDWTAALDWWRQGFQAKPRLETYQALQRVAGQVGQWEALRRELIKEIRDGEKWGLLIEVLLDEGDVARALKLLSQLPSTWHNGSYAMQVAEAAEADYPEAALRIYQNRVERFINMRGRKNYRKAASLLTHMREIYHRNEAQNAWQEYIADLRRRHHRLPALQDELKIAGL